MSGQDPPHNSRLPGTLRNVVSNWASYIFSIVLTFFLSPFVVHHLGSAGYGVWVVIVSLTGYLGLLDLGVRGAVTRYVAKFHTESDYDEASRVASSAVAVFSTLGVLAISISLVLSAFALKVFHIPEEYHFAVHVVLPVAGVTVAVSLVGGVFAGILVGLQRFELLNLVQVLSLGLRSLVIVVALRAGMGIITLACIQLVFALASSLSNGWLTFRLFPQLRLRMDLAGRKYLHLIFSFSLYTFAMTVSAYLILYTDAVVIGIFLPVSFVTFFSIAGSLVNYSRDLISGISQTMTPLASKLEAHRDLPALQQVILTASRFATALMLPIGLTFMIRGRTFIGLWMGVEFAELSGRLLSILTISAVFIASWQVGGAVMIGISKHKGLVPTYLAAALANLGLSVYLVRKIGVTGVAWGTTLPDLAFCLFFWPSYVRRTLEIPIRTYALSTWGRPGLAMLPFAFATYLIERNWPVSKMLLFFSQVGILLPVAAVGFWFLGLEAGERSKYRQRWILPIMRSLRGSPSL